MHSFHHDDYFFSIIKPFQYLLSTFTIEMRKKWSVIGKKKLSEKRDFLREWIFDIMNFEIEY